MKKLDILNSLEKMKITESMQVYDQNAYHWNHAVGPYGNVGNVSPVCAADLCNKYDIPWYTDGWPYSSGIKVYCESDELWHKIIKLSKV